VFLQLFFCNRSHMLFLQLFFLQSHCAKGAITLRQGCNHSHAWF
jgi:hypothetical protein